MEKKYINYNNSYGNLKVNRKIYNKKTNLKSNIKGNIIGILIKQQKKVKYTISKRQVIFILKISKFIFFLYLLI